MPMPGGTARSMWSCVCATTRGGLEKEPCTTAVACTVTATPQAAVPQEAREEPRGDGEATRDGVPWEELEGVAVAEGEGSEAVAACDGDARPDGVLCVSTRQRSKENKIKSGFRCMVAQHQAAT